MTSILIIEDNESFRKAISLRFRKDGYDVHGTSGGIDGLKMLADNHYDLVITDLKMPEVDGLTIIKEAKIISPLTEIILITAFGTVETAVEAIKFGAYDYITKESDFTEISIIVERALEKKKMAEKIEIFEKELREKYDFKEIIAKSPEMLEVLKTVTKVSNSDTSVLVTGKSGTGKELIGKAIHYNSQRRNNPVIIINCGAIPENLQESELFGHKKGSFSGAVGDKKGLIEEAEGGTIIFDEVGELSSSAQVKLLRFLQNKEIRKVGDNISKIIDVRVIAMTNRDLAQEVSENNFREDLYFRLNVIPIKIPELKQRPSDIDLLINHFLDISKEKVRNPGLEISRRALAMLCSYSWPGNVRELENTVERIVILCDGKEITVEDLPREITGESAVDIPNLFKNNLTLAELERRRIIEALEQNAGNKSHTAEMLGIARSTLNSKNTTIWIIRKLLSKFCHQPH